MNQMESKIDVNSPMFKISCRLVIKNIPESLSDEQIFDIFKKNFADHIKNNTLIVKLEKKYSLKKRNKICFCTVDNLETRQKVYDFFSTFELVDPKGIKQKLTVNDCLLQNKINGTKDEIENSIETCEHFLKFKEYMQKEKLVEFKAEEDKCNSLYITNIVCSDIYEIINKEEPTKPPQPNVTTVQNAPVTQKSGKKGKMIIMKKNKLADPQIQQEIKEESATQPQAEIEIIQESSSSSSKYYNNNSKNYRNNYNEGGYYGKKKKGDGNYYGGNKKKGYGGYNDGYYDDGYYDDGYKGGYKKGGGYRKGYK